jgi:hypothetical protein
VRAQASLGIETGVGNGTSAGQSFNESFGNLLKNLLNGNSFIQSDFNTAVQSFKEGSLWNDTSNSPNHKSHYDGFPVENDNNGGVDKFYQ